MKKLLLKLCLALGITALVFGIDMLASSYWYSGVSIEYDDLCGSSPQCYHFWADQVPAADSGYRYFWFFDDGTFSMEEEPQHEFQGSGNRNVYVEITKMYEKDDKPTRIYLGGGSINVNSLDVVSETETPGEFLSVISNRSPRAGDSITYVITYGKMCEINSPATLAISFDPNQLQFKEERHFNSETANVSQVSNGILGFNLNNGNDNLAKRIFLTFLVTDMVKEGIEVNLDCDLSFTGQGCVTFSHSNAQNGVLSHDPNYIVADQRSICSQVSAGDPVVYTIHFQNIGEGMARDVEVKTFLPLFFAYDEAEISPIHPPGIKPVLLGNRELHWKFSINDNTLKNGSGLMGTAQKGYGTAFLEADTKDSVKFQVKFSGDPSMLPYFGPCRKILNRAEIVFDCNPSIYTNFYGTEIVCDTLPIPTSDSCLCVNVFEDVLPALTYSGGLQTLDVTGIGQDVVWYPPVYLTDLLGFNPGISPTRSLDFVAMVHGDSCSYKLLQFPVEINCDLKIKSQVSFKNCGTTSELMGRIAAEAMTASDENDLIWNWECMNPASTDVQFSKTGKQFILDDCPPGVYHLTVKNTANGCWAEKTFYIPAKCPKSSFPWGKGLIGVLIVAGALVLYGILKKKKP